MCVTASPHLKYSTFGASHPGPKATVDKDEYGNVYVDNMVSLRVSSEEACLANRALIVVAASGRKFVRRPQGL